MQLSIITINRNNKEGLRSTIESVVMQTCKDYEFIVIDGNSDDGSQAVIEEYKDRIDYWVSEPDKGIYNAMNKGIAKATGDYCLFLNSGDRFINDMVLKKVLPNLSSKDDFYSGVEMMSDDKSDKMFAPPPADFDMGFLMEGSLRHQSTFIKTSLLKERPFKEEYHIVSDWETYFYWLILKNATYKPIDVVVSLLEMDNSVLKRTQATKEVKEERKRCLEALLPKLFLDFVYYVPTSMEEDVLSSRLPRKLYKKIYFASGMPTMQRDLKILRNVFKQLLKDLF